MDTKGGISEETKVFTFEFPSIATHWLFGKKNKISAAEI